jgi:hypothetical protein
MKRQPKLRSAFARHARPHFRILLDENLSPRVQKSIPDSFAETTLMKSAGLKGRKDHEIWDWAVAHRIDAIITHDWKMKKEGRDLTLIAVAAARRIIEENGGMHDRDRLTALPLIIHLDGRGDPAATMKTIMDKFGSKLTDYVRDIRKGGISYINISLQGITPGKSWAEFIYDEHMRDSRNYTRTEALERKWMNKILSRSEGIFGNAAKANLERKLRETAAALSRPQSGPSSQPS